MNWSGVLPDFWNSFGFNPGATPITPQLCLAWLLNKLTWASQADSGGDVGVTDQTFKASFEVLMIQVFIFESLDKIPDMVGNPIVRRWISACFSRSFAFHSVEKLSKTRNQITSVQYLLIIASCTDRPMVLNQLAIKTSTYVLS